MENCMLRLIILFFLLFSKEKTHFSKIFVLFYTTNLRSSLTPYQNKEALQDILSGPFREIMRMKQKFRKKKKSGIGNTFVEGFPRI